MHVTQGVCLFRGIKAHEHNGRTEDFVGLEFAEKSMLHLPVRESHLLTRYIGIGRAHPKLSRLGGGGWEKSRKAAEKATADLAAQLLAMQAARSTKPGITHPKDAENAWMGEFERSFPHRETPDQTRAIIDVKADMERPAPMDRLISGDVGFGKTEVALRAAFKCVLGGRQVAILAPTTVLAQQHFESFKDRLSRWPVSVELLSSYRTAKQKADVRARAAAENRGRITVADRADEVDLVKAQTRPMCQPFRYRFLHWMESHNFLASTKPSLQFGSGQA